MPDSHIITPFFFEAPVPELASLPFDGHSLNDAIIEHENPVARFVSRYPRLADFTHRTLARGDRPVSIAGDCCATIAVMAGLQRAGVEPTLIWLDAHGDFNTGDSSPTGFLGGMPLAMIAGLGDRTLCESVGLTPVDSGKILLTDARGLDPAEAKLVAGSGLKHVTEIADLLRMELPDGPLYVHFDTDIIDPREMFAAAQPVPGGPTATTVAAVLRRLRRSGQVVAASMSCWTPGLDRGGLCQEICVNVFKKLLA